ncbi:MAG: hypothetical protein ACI4U0_00100 [Candidatus Aphodocola sp.]
MENGIDLLDHWCWVTSLSYTYPHWLYDVFIYLVYFNFGYFGIYISTIVLFIILILTVYMVHLKMHKNEFLALFFSIICIACLYGFATARAQLVTAILFLLEVYFIELLISTGKKKYIFFLMIISLLIANLHATIWLFYFILYLPFLGEYLVSKILHLKFFKKNVHLSCDNKITFVDILYFKEFFASFILSFFMGVFTPSRICYTYVFRIMMGNSQSFIIEHKPLIVIQQPIFLLFILIMLLVLIFSDTKFYLRELFMIGGLTLMSLVSTRHIVFFYIIGCLYISIFVARYLKNKNDKTLDILGSLLINRKSIYLLLLFTIILFSVYKFQDNFSSNDYVSKEEYPIDAVYYIKENLNLDDLRLYNGYNFGSYLMFQEIPVFVDSRCDLYLSEFNGLNYSIFDDEMNIEYNYEKKFKFYRITHALVSKEDILFIILKHDDDYRVIYQDKYFVLFEKV